MGCVLNESTADGAGKLQVGEKLQMDSHLLEILRVCNLNGRVWHEGQLLPVLFY